MKGGLDGLASLNAALGGFLYLATWRLGERKKKVAFGKVSRKVAKTQSLYDAKKERGFGRIFILGGLARKKNSFSMVSRNPDSYRERRRKALETQILHRGFGRLFILGDLAAWREHKRKDFC